jgi:ADP-heptose:LPS heptosyltransferase
VRALKTQVPAARIVFATKPAYMPLLEANPYIDTILPLEGSLIGLALKAYQLGVTHIVDLHANVRSRVLSALFPFAKVYRVQKGTADREKLIKSRAHTMQPLHMADRHLAALAPLGVRWDGDGLDFVVPAKDAVDYRTWSLIGQVPYVAVAIGGSHATKKLPEAKAVELLRTISYPVILLGGKAEQEEGQRIAGTLALEGRWDIFSACGTLSLGQSGSVLAQAQEVYSYDTGLMHMAAGLGKTIHTIWGSTVPAFGMYPFGGRFSVREVAGLPCRPCHRHGADICPQGHFMCMHLQDFSQPEEAWHTIQEPTTRAAMAIVK